MSRLKSAVAIAALLFATETLGASERMQIVLDMSGSMAAMVQGKSRATSAREAIAAALATVPDDVPVSLRLYGHRVHKDQKDESCRDTQKVVDFQSRADAQIMAALSAAQPLGQTPIEFALREAAADLGPPSSTGNTVILLISDGNETCGGDPVALVDELLQQGFKMRVYTVGLSVDKKARKQLEDISRKTGGTYTDAENTEKLEEAIIEATGDAVLGPNSISASVVKYAKNVKGPQRVIATCKPGKALGRKIADLSHNVRVQREPTRPTVLDMRVVEVEGRSGGIWTGPKSVTVEGTLRKRGVTVGSFRAQRGSLGGVLKSGSTCAIFHRAAELVAADIDRWLDNPTMDARLGDLAR